MKNKILVGLMTIGLLSSTTSVYAMGNATVSFNSDDTVTVGDTFTVKMNVEDIKDTSMVLLVWVVIYHLITQKLNIFLQKK